jgi:DNA repair exonuclease SbcCD ATPase subunit
MDSCSTIVRSAHNRSIDLYTPTLQKLQDSSEKCVKRLHRETIKGEKLDAELKILKEQLLQKSLALRSKQGVKKADHRETHKLLVLENSLEASNIRLNDIILENQKLQKQIDHMRNHKNATLKLALNYEKNITSACEKAKEFNDVKIKNEDMQKNHNRLLSRIHEEYTSETSICESKISELSTELKEFNKCLPQTMRSSLEPPKVQALDMTEIEIYKRLIDRYKVMIVNKDKDLNEYQSRIKGLSAAIEKVDNEKVNGRTFLEEFLSSFEINRSAEHHLCKLEDEISSLESILYSSKDRIYICKNSAKMNYKQRSSILSSRKETITNITSKLTCTQSKLDLIRSHISGIHPNLRDISSLLASKGITAINYTPIITTLEITERNAVETIVQVFEQLETYLLYHSSSPEPGSSTFLTAPSPPSYTPFSKMNISEILDRSDIEWEEENSPMSLKDMKKKAYDKFSKLTA